MNSAEDTRRQPQQGWSLVGKGKAPGKLTALFIYSQTAQKVDKSKQVRNFS